jgi:hypothetical protein
MLLNEFSRRNLNSCEVGDVEAKEEVKTQIKQVRAQEVQPITNQCVQTKRINNE